ncbi:MAG: hypothetical protein ACRDOI_17070 [Trebonia sp.]
MEMNRQEPTALDKLRGIRAAHLAATWRALADLLKLLPGLAGENDPDTSARGLLYCDDSEDAAGLPGLVAALMLPVPVPPEGDLRTPEARRGAQGEAYRRAPGARGVTENMAEELRYDADTLEEFPRLVRHGPGTAEFERELYEAGCLRDGLASDEIDFQLPDDDGDGGDGGDGGDQDDDEDDDRDQDGEDGEGEAALPPTLAM